MRFKALVIQHLDFDGRDGKHIKTTKLLVNLAGFRIEEICTELADDLDLFTECYVTLGLKDTYRKDGKPNYKVLSLDLE